MLDEHDRAAKFQHPHDFTKRLALVRDATEHQSADDRVHAAQMQMCPRSYSSLMSPKHFEIAKRSSRLLLFVATRS